MDAVDEAKKLFEEAGLAFPAIPVSLASSMQKLGNWLYSTKSIQSSPYNLACFEAEGDVDRVDEYALLAHSGHGSNSYAIQYYLVTNRLRLFLFLGWGGLYSDSKEDSELICDCFSLADQVVAAFSESVSDRPNVYLKVVASDFYGSYWSTATVGNQPPITHSVGRPIKWEPPQPKMSGENPKEILGEVLEWTKREAQVQELLKELLSYATKEGRVCPKAGAWHELWKLLPNRRRVGAGGWEPALPLILAGWEHSDDSDKRERFLLHLRYAASNGALNVIDSFVRNLNSEAWYFGSK